MLHYAVESGNLESLRVLLKHSPGLDLNSRTRRGDTPLVTINKEDEEIINVKNRF